VLVADRYRIIALLGKGGMGEVYRADDLVLGQPVALKFLPEAASADEDVLERFHNEVRTARRVSHPNVCRVYDVGEVEGLTFLSMEYVDGEDLSSLLRRIGRIPQDKALEIARQVCAGLAAAHQEGVLHRDLKPANVMLDGRGHAVITDFGLAGFADQIKLSDVRSGTPAYMAPEQLAGDEVTARSDLYSLGLVFYEIFSGKRAFEASTIAELVRERNERPVSSPSNWVKDLDPAVERVIMRCLEADPARRPASALSVAAALPGGDPLAAALAAGETPSPAMVAAAGETTGLTPRVAVACLAVAILALLGLNIWGARISLLEMLSLPYSADDLRLKARDMLGSFGYKDEAVDSAGGFSWDANLTEYIQENDKPRPRWEEVVPQRPAPLYYWYRQSPHDLIAEGTTREGVQGIVTPKDPPPIASGMIQMNLDYAGRLLFLEAIPPERDESPIVMKPVDWKTLFSASGLEIGNFQPTVPVWNSLSASDARAAWIGKWPGTSRPLRVEAAAYRGRPVYFSLIGPWTKPSRAAAADSAGTNAHNLVRLCLLLAMLIGGALLARRNYSQGKGDRRGAFRFAAVLLAVRIASWPFFAHLVPAAQTFDLVIEALAIALLESALVWVVYLALEPFVRRHWPQAIISWSRLIAGRFRDPVLGRDLLIGVLLGLAWVFVYTVRYVAILHRGAPPIMSDSDFLQGGRWTIGAWLQGVPGAVVGTLMFFFVLFICRVFLRRQWLAALAFVAFFTGMRVLGSDYPLIELASQSIIYAVAAVAIVRFGFVALIAGVFTANMLLNVPMTTRLSDWFAGNTIFLLLTVIALSAWGFYTSLGGQRLFKEGWFE
jgi:serine/threonine-protein kinase